MKTRLGRERENKKPGVTRLLQTGKGASAGPIDGLTESCMSASQHRKRKIRRRRKKRRRTATI